MERGTRRESEVGEIRIPNPLRHTPQTNRVADISAEVSMPGGLEPTGGILRAFDDGGWKPKKGVSRERLHKRSSLVGRTGRGGMLPRQGTIDDGSPVWLIGHMVQWCHIWFACGRPRVQPQCVHVDSGRTGHGGITQERCSVQFTRVV